MQHETLQLLSKLEMAKLGFDILGSSNICGTPVLRTSGHSKLSSATLALSNLGFSDIHTDQIK